MACRSCGVNANECTCLADLPAGYIPPEQEPDRGKPCAVCCRALYECSCPVPAGSSDYDKMIATMRPMSPPAKLRWLADDMENALATSCTRERIEVWANTLLAMHSGLLRGAAGGGSRNARRVGKKLRRKH